MYISFSMKRSKIQISILLFQLLTTYCFSKYSCFKNIHHIWVFYLFSWTSMELSFSRAKLNVCVCVCIYIYIKMDNNMIQHVLFYLFIFFFIYNKDIQTMLVFKKLNYFFFHLVSLKIFELHIFQMILIIINIISIFSISLNIPIKINRFCF